MFSGIIECAGIVEQIIPDKSNAELHISAPFANELKIDQSVAHNGVCLTVVGLFPGGYSVVAISETLQRSNLASCKVGDQLNLERCIQVGGRLDGHIVQGHVDETARCISLESMNGSWMLGFSYSNNSSHVTVPKGSICVNGVSLTVVDSDMHTFTVAVIPYTWENTNLGKLKPGSVVNLEFDIVGKYIARLMKQSGN